MNATIEVFAQVRQAATLSEKISLLKNRRSDLVDLIAADAMDKSITYGITSKGIEIQKQREDHWFGSWYDGFHRILERLASRELTGNAAIECITGYLGYWDEETQRFLLQVLDRDLSLGSGWDTYRSEVLGLNDQFEVALAQHLEKVKGVDPVDGTWFASRKCDGCRDVTIHIAANGSTEFRSRQNKVFTTLDNLKAEAARFLSPLGPGEWVLDGELCKVDENGNEDFQAVMKEIRKKDYTITSCCYQVFDVLTYDEFRLGKSRKTFSQRLEILNKLNAEYVKQPHGACWVKPLKQERLTCQEDFDRWAGYVEAGNWEGFMLRKDVPYQSGRTKDLLKVKKFSDLEAVVLDVVVGEMTTALPGKGNETFTGVRSLVINYKGNIVNVGAGLTREQRIEWYKDPSKIIGSDICVKYFEETVAQDGKCSLRFPTLKYAYSGKRDV